MNPKVWTTNSGVFIMAKLTKQDKAKIIFLYNQGFGCDYIAHEMKLNRTRVKEIKRLYDLYGESTLEISHKHRQFSPEYKLELIKRVVNGESLCSVASQSMIGFGQLSNWVKKYFELGYNGLSKPKGRPKIMKNEPKKTIQTNEDEKDKLIRELKERNAQLEMENDLLKKLRALVQQRTQQPNKKK